MPTDLSVLKDIFGEWDWMCDHGNGVYVWDEIGMLVFTPQEKTTTDWITILFEPPIECSPKQMFEGTLEIEDLSIDSETSKSDLVEAGYHSTTYQKDIDHYRITMTFDPTEGNLRSVRISVMYSNM